MAGCESDAALAVEGKRQECHKRDKHRFGMLLQWDGYLHGEARWDVLHHSKWEKALQHEYELILGLPDVVPEVVVGPRTNGAGEMPGPYC